MTTKSILTKQEAHTGANNIVSMLRNVPVLGDQQKYLHLLSILQDYITILGEES